ncbi:MAG: hypothetical protein WC533_02005 [Candidatus Pacearchaeota archaeon]
MKSEIQFINEKLLNSFEKLSNSNYEDKELVKFIKRAFEDIKENPFCGIQTPKKQILKIYLQKHQIKNLWKYNLPNAWKLLYSIKSGKIFITQITIK